MNTFKYICKYCHEQYIPKRRYSQKYCSNSCRSKAYHRRQIEKNKIDYTAAENNNTSTQPVVTPDEIIQQKKQYVEEMSVAGVKNVVAGTLIADLIKYIAQGNGNQPATKNDIATMMNQFQRYHLITNLPPRTFGKRPYFDFHTNKVIYL